MSQHPHQFCQLGVVVDDLDTAIAAWTASSGLGPWFIARHCGDAMSELSYRGSPLSMDISVALAQSAGLQIELIEQHDETASPYRDTFAIGESGVHHLCSFVPDVDVEVARLTALGGQVAMRGLIGASPFAYVDTRPTIGVMTEVIAHGEVEASFARVAAESVGWDGTDPMRSLF